MKTVKSLDGTKLVYEAVGSGKPVVLVGGAFNNRSSTEPLGKLLAESGLTAVSYDRRGRGDSLDTDNYAVDREVEDLATVLHEVGSTWVYGMSSGALLALKAASLGVVVDRIAVYEPPLGAPNAEAFADEQAERIRGGRSDEAVEAFLATTGLPAQGIAEMREGPSWIYLTALAHTLPYDARIVARTTLETVGRVEAATLVVDGAASSPFLRDAAAAIVDAMPNATGVSLEGQTHNVDVAVLAPVLAKFFS
ncbi:alpha/beta hydrolase [Actinokineospora auranticolor]|uniref:Alpha/beta hydrolase family protein n=1 Tax=Actinokineospora auranticolor TaxID=155976 RepID=A0A2S6GWB6_9PSEU|nr:alpha/beta hydrolase [Actinokineospora auranticolor]PPK69451.1 alpha/beta hydrolase family protein [Actinokineospora auranticolor]